MAYITRQNDYPLSSFLPKEPGLHAHVWRVATLAARASEYNGFTNDQVETIACAGLLHHYPLEQTESEMESKILSDLGLTAPEGPGPMPERAAEIVRVLRGDLSSANPFHIEAAAIVESANLFDEQIENCPYEEASPAEAMNELAESGILAPGFLQALQSFRVLTREQLSDSAARIPVFSSAAVQALRLLRNDNQGLRELEAIVSRDQALADEIVRLANSGLFGTRDGVSSPGAALARVGTNLAAKLIATAAWHGCFEARDLERLWVHSLEAGENAVAVAGTLTGLNAGEAFLAGLVHDVGRLAFEISDSAPALYEWIGAGFPATYAEFIISGTDHAEVGARILAAWQFPQDIVEGVAFHHRPERTQCLLSAVLYDEEEVDEALPSCARDTAVAKRLKVVSSGHALAAC